MADWPGMNEAVPYGWTGLAGVIGRLMYHARQVQMGKRKPLGWVLLFDLPIALGMGWLILGIGMTMGLLPQATVSAAITAGYLGPWAIDRLFSAWSARFFGKADK